MENGSSTLMETIREEFPDFAYFRVLFFVLGICGTLLNLTSIGLLLSIKGRLRTQLKLFLNLAICDCLIAIIFVVKATVYVDTVFMLFLDIRPELYGLPRVILSVTFISIQWSGLVNMLFIAVDILLRVKRPLEYRHLMSKRRGNILITCAWVTSFLTFTNPATINTVMQGNQIIYLIHPIASVLSLIAFCIIYGCVIYGIRHSQRGLNREGSMSYTGHRSPVRRMAVTTACVLVSYIICLMPVMWFFVLINAHPSKTDANSVLIALVLECVFLLNALIDPLIYVTRVPEVTCRLRDVLKHVRQWRPGRDEEETTTMAKTSCL